MPTWADLPPEIIEQILRPLDDDDLVSKVSCVSRRMNSLAFREYLKRKGIRESKDIYISILNTHTTLRALRAADWIKNVRCLSVSFDLTRSAFHEIHGLARFIRGLDSLSGLNFRISRGRSLGSSTPFEKPLKWRDPWWECCRALFNAALLKGVEQLHISEWVSDLASVCIDMDHRSDAQLRWGLEHSIRNGWTKICSYVRLGSGGNPNSSPKYSTVCLCAACSANADSTGRISDIQLSPMLLSPLFFRDTFGILRANTSTINTIYVDAVSLPLVYQDGTWNKMFGQLQFPLLKCFTFTGPSETGRWKSGVPINNLFSFLNRHPTITYLRLDNIPSTETLGLTFTRDPPSLPNITYLVARDDVAAHILQRPENCKHLDSVQLLSSPNRSWCPDLPGPRPALAALAFNTPSTSSPIWRVGLGLETADDCLDWANEGAGDDSHFLGTPPTLKVHNLDISLGSGILLDIDALLNVVPRWIGTFTHLERLCIGAEARYARYFYGSRYKSSFVAAIIRSCPHLKSLRIGGTEFCSGRK